MSFSFLVKRGSLRNVYGMPASPFLEELSDHLFWDVDRDSVDTEKHARFLICRIMDRGTRKDARAAWVHYGPEGVKAALLKAPDLDRKTIAFFANQFGLPREAFRAWRGNRKTWNP